MSFSYQYLTRKQANIVYAAAKSGRIALDEKTIGAIYDLVGRQDLTQEQACLFSQVQDIVKWLLEGEDEFAQAIADGYFVVPNYVEVVRPATEDDWFYEPGEDVVETQLDGYKVMTREDYWAERERY